jgi:hypothetical protein
MKSSSQHGNNGGDNEGSIDCFGSWNFEDDYSGGDWQVFTSELGIL